MKIEEPYLGQLRQEFSRFTTDDSHAMREIVMVGAWFDRNDGSLRLAIDDWKYLELCHFMLSEYEMPLHRNFNLRVIDLNETNEDFLADPVAADVVILSYVLNFKPVDQQVYEAWFAQNVPGVDRDEITRILSGRNSILQSPLNSDRSVWQGACLTSGARCVMTVFDNLGNAVNPNDFDDALFKKGRLISKQGSQHLACMMVRDL